MYTPMSTVEEYDPLIDAWTTKADMPTARQGLSTSVVNGRIYAIGGSNIGTVWLPGSPIVEEYDPATNMWTTGKADMPTARNFLSTSVVNNMIYAIGGRDGLPDGLANHRAVEVYDPVNDSWSKKADMPTGRAALATSAVDGMIYAIGGSYGIAELPIVGFSHVEEYDTGFVPLNQAVEAKGKLPTMWGAMKERRDTAKKRQD